MSTYSQYGQYADEVKQHAQNISRLNVFIQNPDKYGMRYGSREYQAKVAEIQQYKQEIAQYKKDILNRQASIKDFAYEAGQAEASEKNRLAYNARIYEQVREQRLETRGEPTIEQAQALQDKRIESARLHNLTVADYNQRLIGDPKGDAVKMADGLITVNDPRLAGYLAQAKIYLSRLDRPISQVTTRLATARQSLLAEAIEHKKQKRPLKASLGYMGSLGASATGGFIEGATFAVRPKAWVDFLDVGFKMRRKDYAEKMTQEINKQLARDFMGTIISAPAAFAGASFTGQVASKIKGRVKAFKQARLRGRYDVMDQFPFEQEIYGDFPGEGFGDESTLLGYEKKTVRISDPGKGRNVSMDVPYYDEITGAPGKIEFFDVPDEEFKLFSQELDPTGMRYELKGEMGITKSNAPIREMKPFKPIAPTREIKPSGRLSTVVETSPPKPRATGLSSSSTNLKGVYSGVDYVREIIGVQRQTVRPAMRPSLLTGASRQVGDLSAFSMLGLSSQLKRAEAPASFDLGAPLPLTSYQLRGDQRDKSKPFQGVDFMNLLKTDVGNIQEMKQPQRFDLGEVLDITPIQGLEQIQRPASKIKTPPPPPIFDLPEPTEPFYPMFDYDDKRKRRKRDPTLDIFGELRIYDIRKPGRWFLK